MSCRTNVGDRKQHEPTKSRKFRASGPTWSRQPSQDAVVWLSPCAASLLPPQEAGEPAGAIRCCWAIWLLKPQQRQWGWSPCARGSPAAPSAACRTGPAPPPCQGHGSTMFATVRFGANCQEMVNLLCSVQTLTGHLKWKCQCRPEDCIDLVDEKGTLMNLSKVEDPASDCASKYLQGRQRYVLVRAAREENSEAICYESLLEDLGKHYPDLPDRLQQLSEKTQRTEQRKKGSLQRAQPHTSTRARNRTTSQSKRSLEHKRTPK
ncbi:uncharacterized protein C22orf15 homolog isoform X2 [Passer montanus]|uniref:uncharacterized protein C22orf15 homolog isoform X2 n=1 Tax=Passer montanus TaxID=9160 RepID=UPI00195FCF65|nr:uncharacterized protein C22orf15 homolog isoform X2 [Passer montanus]